MVAPKICFDLINTQFGVFMGNHLRQFGGGAV